MGSLVLGATQQKKGGKVGPSQPGPKKRTKKNPNPFSIHMFRWGQKKVMGLPSLVKKKKEVHYALGKGGCRVTDKPGS